MTGNSLLERATRFVHALRHCQILGITVHDANDTGMTLRLPYGPAIVGDPETGIIHGGALTSLMDTTCGIATLCVLPEFEVCPTLDLRIDYMHPAAPHQPVYGFAQCYRVTADVIFTRGFAYQDDPQQPIAHVVGTFMRMGKLLKGAQGLSATLDGEQA
ncbi:PaaI family thioesterase [Pseudomonas sp. Leaf59]|uniref:PaaI family thioesterase n=1 Tax=Pseudomonas sp. Leaf59 TaxID=2876556 RepID=UPI001E41B4E9|nr:PaaI family thioesterase [Pseudomonas sp. Leaf59]